MWIVISAVFVALIYFSMVYDWHLFFEVALYISAIVWFLAVIQAIAETLKGE